MLRLTCMIVREKEPDMVNANIGQSTTLSPSLPESSQASESARILAQYLTAEILTVCHLQFDSGGSRKEGVAIPDAAVRLLVKILEELAKGNAVTVSSATTELTTQQAADLLNVSRPFLVQQLKKGLISFRKVGSHRRLHLNDVLQYKQSMDQKRPEALDQVSDLNQKLGGGS